MKSRFILLSCLLFSLLSIGANAQVRIYGSVKDNSGALPGAIVKLEGSSLVTSTDAQGDFKFTHVSAGKFKLKVTFIGYVSFESDLEVSSSGELKIEDILLREESNTLSDVVVSSVYRPSQARALSMKRISPNIVEVLAADAIGKLPDRNAAEAVQRMQGVSIERDMGEGRYVSVRGTPIQWSSATLNGNRMPSASGDNSNRGLQMDIFPSELIQYVKLAKAITPDMDGDAIGGSVDFITKSAVKSETFSANLAGGYVDQSRKSSYNASLVYGNKITNKLRFISTAVIWDRSSALDNFQMIYDFNNSDYQKSFAINQLQIRDYVARRRTLGFNGALEYDISNNHKLYFKGLYSQYLDQQTVRETYFNINQNNAQLQSRHADYVTDLYNFQLGGKSQLNDKLVVDWSLFRARSSFEFGSPKNIPSDQRGYPIVNFIQPMTYGGRSSDGLKYLAMDAPDGLGDTEKAVVPHLQSALSADQMRLNQVIMAQSRNSERDNGVKVDLGLQHNPKMLFKGGLKLLDKKKDINTKTLVWMPAANLGIPNAQPVWLKDLDREEFAYNGGFLSEIGSPYNNAIINHISNKQIDQLYTNEFREANGLILVQGPEAPANQPTVYSGNENVYAAYLMTELDLTERLQATIGFRNEYNDISFHGKRVVNAGGSNVAVENVDQSNTYNAFLPMLHLKYKLTDKTLLRGALTRSFARADFNSLNPGVIVSDINNTIVEGNTSLKPTFSNNVDVMFEHYFEDIGAVTIGGFYKKLSNIIYDNQSVVQQNDKTYIMSRPENLESAWVAGFEVGISKRFTKLPGFLGKMGFEGNYSFVDSKVDIPVFENGAQSGFIKSTLPKQAKHIFNTILFYENNSLMLRLAGNYKGSYLNAIRSAAGPEHYQWFDKNFTLDFSAAYSITPKIRAFFELNNLTNEPNRFYHGNKKRVENVSYNSFRGQLGVSFQFK